MLTNSPFGRNLKAIRDEEELCLSLGKDTQKLKLQAMIVAGTVGGLAGALFAFYIQFISPENFKPIETFLMWAMIIVGGRGNFKGNAIQDTLSYEAIKQNGYSLFGEWKLLNNKISLFGRFGLFH